jgi:hypothetical protein
MRARSGDVETQLVALRVGRDRTIILESRSSVAHTIDGGWLTVPTRAPCTGGAELSGFLLDGQDSSPHLPTGRHLIELRTDEAINLSLNLVFDLRLDGDACVRTPVLSQSIAMEVRSRPSVVLSSLIEPNASVSGYTGLVGMQVGAGTWWGPLFFSADVGLGAAVCAKDTCGQQGNDGQKTTLTFPAAVNARLPVGHALWGSLTNVFSVGARYSYAPVNLPALDGDRHLSVHGIHGILGWAFNDNLGVRVLHPERAPVYELAIPIGVVLERGGPQNQLGFSMGLDLRILLPL